MVDIETSYQT